MALLNFPEPSLKNLYTFSFWPVHGYLTIKAEVSRILKKTNWFEVKNCELTSRRFKTRLQFLKTKETQNMYYEQEALKVYHRTVLQAEL
jgi:hypothetical protein